MNKIFAAGILLAAHGLAAAPPVMPKLPQGNISYVVTVRPAESIRPEAAQKGGSGNAPVQASLETIEVSRFGDTTRYELRWSSGQKSETWQVENPTLLIVQNPWANDLFVARSGVAFPPILTRLDKKALDWLSPAGGTQEETYKGVKCLNFKRTIRLKDAENPEPFVLKYEAWIDANTGLPVALSDGENIFEFDFNRAAPSAPLVLPETFQKRLARFRAAASPPKHL